jgi:GT2 family glycosyltransferase
VAPAPTPDATVVITTKDRREVLDAAIASALGQRGARVEVLVVDDGSTDGTSAMVAERHPAARLVRSERSLGYIAQRNRAAAVARAPILVSIDDDARLTSPDTVAQTLADFDDARIGAVAMPFLDVRGHETALRQVAPDDDATWVTNAYVGTAHAIRRDLFLALGGYREALGRQGEEFDLCLRMLAAGRVVRLGRADRLEHHEAPRRNERLIRLSTRNEIVRAYRLVPLPDALEHGAKQIVGGLLIARRLGAAGAGARGTLDAAREIARTPRSRRPVGRAAFRVDRLLRRRGPLPLERVAPLLPPPDDEAPGARLPQAAGGATAWPAGAAPPRRA